MLHTIYIVSSHTYLDRHVKDGEQAMQYAFPMLFSSLLSAYRYVHGYAEWSKQPVRINKCNPQLLKAVKNMIADGKSFQGPKLAIYRGMCSHKSLGGEFWFSINISRINL